MSRLAKELKILHAARDLQQRLQEAEDPEQELDILIEEMKAVVELREKILKLEGSVEPKSYDDAASVELAGVLWTNQGRRFFWKLVDENEKLREKVKELETELLSERDSLEHAESYIRHLESK